MTIESRIEAVEAGGPAPDLTSCIRAYALVEDLKAEVKALSTRVEAQLVRMQQLAIDAFVEAEVTDITVDGRRWKPNFEAKVAIDYPEGADDATKAAIAQRVVDWIVSQPGGKDLVKPAMHHARRDSFLRDHLIDDEGVVHIPDELAGLVKEVDLPKLSARKVG